MLRTSMIRLAGAGALALALAAGAQTQGELELRALLQSQGYTDIEQVAFDETDGLWSASAVAPDGTPSELRVHVPTGSVLQANVQTPPLDRASIEEHLATLGYQDVHNLRFDGAVWRAEAESPVGHELLVLVDPNDGRIIDQRGD